MHQLHSFILSLFAAAIAIPLLIGFWRWGVAGIKGAVLVTRRCWQARHPVEAAELAISPLRPDLSLHGRRFAHTTRALVASLEYASQRSACWRDDAPRSWLTRWATLGRDEDFRPTIGVTGEIWGWLQSAEALADSDDPHAHPIGHVAVAVRDALLRAGPLGPRLTEMLAHLVRADTELRTCSTSPYRDGSSLPFKAPPSETEDEAQIRRRRDYERALREHEGAISNVARKCSNDTTSTEDLIQEIKLSVWKAFDRFRGHASLKTYVLRIAHYRGASFLRRQRVTLPAEDVIDPRSGPGELIDDARRRVAVAQEIERLPCAQREAIMLLLEGLSYREIGARLGITDKATSVRITRARRSLRRRLSEA